MRLPALLRALTGSTAVVILRATGLPAAIPFAALALATVTLFPDGRIERVGPVLVQPAISVVLLAPLLLAIGCGVVHATWRSPVIHRSRRVHLARALSYGTALASSTLVVLLGGALSTSDTVGGALRNLLWMSGVTVATAALLGIVHAWLPVVLLCGAGLLSSATENPWTLYGLLFHDQATAGQYWFAGLACGVGVAIGVWDPCSRGYLRQR